MEPSPSPDEMIEPSPSPQGSPLSPLLFLLFINPLVEELNDMNGAEGLFYADDTILIADNEVTARRILQHTDDWCARNDIRLNRPKSGVMTPRLPHQKRANTKEEFAGIPIVEEYNCLGVRVDATFQLKPDTEVRKEKEQKLIKAQRILSLNHISLPAKYHNTRPAIARSSASPIPNNTSACHI